MRNTVNILGIPIDKLNTQEALDRMEYFITTRRFHQVATANTNFLVNGLFDPELRYILRVCDMVVPDGMLVVRAAGALKSRIEERVTGADLVPRLSKISAQKGYRIFMLGGKPENAQRARENMLEKYPGLNIVGCLSPNVRSILSKEDNEPILDAIEAAKPDVLLVAFGNPKQEKWIHLHRERLAKIPVPVCIGVGGTFDFLSGAVPRAPYWMQDCGLEFVWRFLLDPWRLGKRYAHDFWHFLPSLWQQYRAMHRPPSQETPEVTMTPVVDNSVIFTIGGHFDKALSEEFATLADQAIQNEKHLVLEFKPGTTFDADGMSVLIMLPKRATYKERSVFLVAPPKEVQTLFRRSQLDDALFQTFRTVTSVTEALRNGQEEKSWTVDCREGRAIITLQNRGHFDQIALSRMMTACLKTLRDGTDVDLDARCIQFADSFFLLTLRQLHEAARCRNGATPHGLEGFRIVPSEAVHQRLEREKMTEEFVLISAEELGQARYTGRDASHPSHTEPSVQEEESGQDEDADDLSNDSPGTVAMYHPAAF
jgi:N-acetylglucosaminyldiphosphoundecaprenol N-acetyl-beta-D-mannosaminyltransferase